MTKSMSQVAQERTRDLLLARLLVFNKAAPLGKLVEAVAHELGADDASSAAYQALDACEQSGHISVEGKRVHLTEHGRAQALAGLALKSLPSRPKWQNLKARLALLALGSIKVSAGKLDGDVMAGQILIATYSLSCAKTLTQAVQQLAWRVVGVESAERIAPVRLQRHLLREFIPADARVTDNVWRRMLAMRAIDAGGHDLEALTQALLTRWLTEAGLGSPPQVPCAALPSLKGTKTEAVRNDNGPTPSHEQPTLSEFARAVRDAARNPAVIRFHGDRAFIGSIWEHMSTQHLIGDMSLDQFKDKLVSAHRAQLLEMARADLVGAMDPSEVRRSEARYQNSTFHFVTLNAGGL